MSRQPADETETLAWVEMCILNQLDWEPDDEKTATSE